MNKNLKEKGITLVALVVTIIILLILAGITINLVVGENGLLQRAQMASNTMANATANEMKMMGEYETEINEVNNPSHGLTKVGSTTLSSSNVSGNEALKAHYGEMTDFTSVGEVQWQLFYDDADYCYVIASDYVDNGKLTNASDLVKTGVYTNYCAYFGQQNAQYGGTAALSTKTGSVDIANNTFNQKYLQWPLQDAHKDSIEVNMKAVAYMMDTSKWSNFTGKYGEFAIGGPTVEMFAKSYNAKHSTNQMGTYDTLDSTNSNQYGYMVKLGTGNWNSYISGLDTNSGNGNMWVIANSQKAYGMWLASPSSGGGANVFCVNYSGTLSIGSVASISNGFRPLVSIPKSSIQ